MPPGMREEQTEVTSKSFDTNFQANNHTCNIVGEEQQLRDKVWKIWLESSPDQGMLIQPCLFWFTRA